MVLLNVYEFFKKTQHHRIDIITYNVLIKLRLIYVNKYINLHLYINLLNRIMLSIENIDHLIV